jgi:hypothetical protein
MVFPFHFWMPRLKARSDSLLREAQSKKGFDLRIRLGEQPWDQTQNT